jgi:hypothetical protein
MIVVANGLLRMCRVFSEFATPFCTILSVHELSKWHPRSL